MIKKKKGLCHKCEKERWLKRNKPPTCEWCYAIEKKKPIKKKPRKATGERVMFLEIWSERPHICENCRTPLGSEPKTFFFSHIKGKKAHPELRLVKSNIELLCFDCHDAWERNRDKYQARKR